MKDESGATTDIDPWSSLGQKKAFGSRILGFRGIMLQLGYAGLEWVTYIRAMEKKMEATF